MTRFHATSEGNIPFTAEEELEWDVQEAAGIAAADSRKAAEIRQERDAKLAALDWTQGKDIADEVSVPAATLRQALRDVPAQAGFPWTITWPDAP